MTAHEVDYHIYGEEMQYVETIRSTGGRCC